MEDHRVGKLLDREDVRLISLLAKDLGVEAWLVGGSLRDLIIARDGNDLDFALSASWEELPRSFSDRVGGSFFWLDEERRQARVLNKGEEGARVYDFSPICGGSIEDDLHLRDFTINAMAVALRGEDGVLIDPLGGMADLEAALVRMCSAASFENDPLRLMRAVRFAAELGFAIEEGTWRELCAKAQLLSGVAAERIREELFKALATTGCGASLRRLCDSRLWAAISPEDVPSGMDSAIARAAEVERLCNDMAGKLAEYLEREVEGGITASSLIRLTSFLGRCGGSVPLLAERIRLGREATRMLSCLCRDEGQLLASLDLSATPRQLFRFFRDREPAGPGMLIVSRVMGEISEGGLSRLLGYFLGEYDLVEGDLFLSGAEVMDILGIPPGKAVGEALARLREGEAAGVVNDREGAVAFVKNLLTKEEAMG